MADAASMAADNMAKSDLASQKVSDHSVKPNHDLQIKPKEITFVDENRDVAVVVVEDTNSSNDQQTTRLCNTCTRNGQKIEELKERMDSMQLLIEKLKHEGHAEPSQHERMIIVNNNMAAKIHDLQKQSTELIEGQK